MFLRGGQGELFPRFGIGDPEMLIGELCGFSPVLHPGNKTDLQEEGFSHIHEGISLLL